MSQSPTTPEIIKTAPDNPQSTETSKPSTIIEATMDNPDASESSKPVKITETELDNQASPESSTPAKIIETDLDNQEVAKSSDTASIIKTIEDNQAGAESSTSPPNIEAPYDNQTTSQSSTPTKIIELSHDNQEGLEISEPPKVIKRRLEDQDSEESSQPPRKRSKSVESLPTETPDTSYDGTPETPVPTMETRDPVELPQGSGISFAETPAPEAPKSGSAELPKFTESIPWDLDQFSGIRSKGLYNPGVLCYRISAVQLLLHNPKFLTWVKKYHGEDACASGKEQGTCLTCALRDLALAYWSRDASLELLDQIMDQVDRILSSLLWECGGANGQGDPDDQLRFMLNRMEEEMSPKAYQALLSFSTLVMNSSMKCELCGDVAVKDNNLEGLLSINLHPKPKADRRKFVYLEQFLKQHFQGDEIGGHRCDKCHKQSDKQRRWEIAHAPDTLTIQFKRFDWEGRKDTMSIGYPEKLDLTPYLVDKTKSAKYELNGVVTHQGRGTSAGHYRTLAKQPASGKWTLLDDELAIPSNITKAVEPSTQMHKLQIPYILTYTRIIDEEKEKEEA